MSENLPLLIGIVSIMMCPMIFGGLCMIYSQQTIEKETSERWKKQGWKND